MARSTHLLHNNIQKLVDTTGLPEAEVARRAGVPQTTLNRILTGKTSAPRAKSLESLAKYFKCSVEDFYAKQTLATEINLLPWEINAFLNHPSYISNDKIIISLKPSKGAFAVKMNDSSMDMVLQKDTTLVIDPNREITDRCIAIIILDAQNKAVCRQIIIDGSKRYIKPLSPNLFNAPMTPITDNDRIVGVLVQSIMNH